MPRKICGVRSERPILNNCVRRIWTHRDKKLLHIPCCLGNRLINISLWWEAVKEQRKAAQSVFKFNKRIANVTIATTDLFWACPDLFLFLLKEHLKWIFLSDFYFYFKNANQQCRFIKSSSCLANLFLLFLSEYLDFWEVYDRSVLQRNLLR